MRVAKHFGVVTLLVGTLCASSASAYRLIPNEIAEGVILSRLWNNPLAHKHTPGGVLRFRLNVSMFPRDYCVLQGRKYLDIDTDVQNKTERGRLTGRR